MTPVLLSYGITFLAVILAVQNVWAVEGQRINDCDLDLISLKNAKNVLNVFLNLSYSRLRFPIQCGPFKGFPSPSCYEWCRLFASHFNQNDRWIKRCSNKFRALSQRFLIANNGSTMKFSVKPCGRLWKGLFIIEIERCNCSVWNKGKEKFTTCQKLTNGKGKSRTLRSSSMQDCLERRPFRYCLKQYLKNNANCTKDLLRFAGAEKRSSNFTIFVAGLNGTMPNLFQIRGKLRVRKSCPVKITNIDKCSCSFSKKESDFLSLLKGSAMNNFTDYITEEIDIGEENVLQNVSFLLETIIQDFKNVSLRDKQVNITDLELKENAHITTVAFEDYVVRYAQQQLNKTTSQYVFMDKVRRVSHQNETEFFLSDKEGGNFIKMSAENIKNDDSVVLGVMYKELQEVFMANRTKPNTTKENRELNTIIMSATIYPQTEVLKKNITLVFRNIKPAGNKRECVFWNYSEYNSEGWSTEGCYVTSMTVLHTECACKHLTHFAVLMDYSDDVIGSSSMLSAADIEILKILTHVGLSLSLLGTVITIICYLLVTDKQTPLCQIHVSLAASLGAGQIAFLAGIDATDNKGACVTAAAFMQYFFMAAFCWMLVEGIYLYLFVVKVYNVSHKMSVYHGMSWGIPAILVAATLCIAAGEDGVKSFVSDKNCWLSSSNGLVWIFVTFVLLIELLNVVILVRVVKEVASMQHAKDQQSEQIKLGIRTCVVLIPLLGVTWIIGLVAPLHKAFVYVFVILNSTQGFFIFILHCVRNSEIRARFKKRMRRLAPAEEISKASVQKNTDANQSSVNEVNPSDIFELQE